MPLFNNFELWEIPETGEISRDTLKKAFPDFYSDNAKPIKIHVLQGKMSPHKRVREKEGMYLPSQRATRAPEPLGLKAIANLVIGGKQVNLQYSDAMPEIGAVRRTFPQGSNRLSIGHGTSIPAGKEDMLFFLYFGTELFVNGFKRVPNPTYEFYKPEVKASESISNWKKQNALKQLIYADLPEQRVVEIMNALKIDLKESDQLNRLALEAAVKTGNEIFVSLFNDLTATKKVEVSEVNVSEIVDTLITDGKIKQEEGKWYGMSKTKTGEWNKTPFYDTKELDENNSRLTLIEHLEQNQVLLDKIK